MGNCLAENGQLRHLDYHSADKSQIGNQRKTLRVATLNYCGIMNSPFEFYCPDFQKQLDELSDIFVSLLPKYVPKFDPATFSWKIGKIDVKFNKGRYSSMFNIKTGIRNGAFISRQQFQKQWQRVFKTDTENIKNFKYTEEQKKAAMLYDTVLYHALLRFVFEIDTIEDAKTKSIKQYINKLQPFFELSYLDQNKKLDKLKQGFSKIDADVFFIQEYSQFFYDYLNSLNIYQLKFDQLNDVLIIAKKQVFPISKKIQQKQTQINEIIKKFNLPGRMATLIVDKYILLCSHLSAKKQENKQQSKALRKGLVELKQYLKDNFFNFQIILGGDLNSYLPHFSNKYYVFPEEEQDLTTVKKRTMTQCQFNKGRVLVEQSKDKIISTLQIIRGSIKYINNQNPKKGSLVPNDSHPFDHLVVVAELQTSN